MNESNNLTDKLGHEKPCRTCMDFRTWMKMSRSSIKKDDTSTQGKIKGTEQTKSMFDIPTEDEYGGRGSMRKKMEELSAQTSPPNPSEMEVPDWGLAAKYGCPADSLSLGRGTWRLLHTMSVYYPDSPTEEVKTDMTNFISLFSKFYPCPPCAEDFRQWIKENPPDVSSRANISKWFCNAHNQVNRKLYKPQFDCSLYDQRWLDGWKDDSCG